MSELLTRMLFSVLADVLEHLEKGDEAISKDRLSALIKELFDYLERQVD